MFQSLSDKFRLAKISVWIALVQQQFYGRSLSPITTDLTSVSVQFKALAACQATIKLKVRCAGLEFELLLVDPDALLQLGDVFTPDVPLHLQAAAFFYSVQPVWKVVEKAIGSPIHFVSVAGITAAVSSIEGLGILISVKDKINGETRKSGAVMRALQPEGWWAILAGSRSSSILNGEQIDFHLVLSIVIETISIALCEFRQTAVGDVLLLDVGACNLGSEPVHLELGNVPIAGVKGKRDGNRLKVTQVDFLIDRKTAIQAENLWTDIMTIDDNGKEASANELQSSAETYQSALDNMVVDVRLELGRLSLPISTLRNLATGQVFDTQKPLDGESVLLSCGGQQLGVGQLIAIGERLGVRIIALQPLPSEYRVSISAASTETAQLKGSSSVINTD